MIDPLMRALYCLHFENKQKVWSAFFEFDDPEVQGIILDFSLGLNSFDSIYAIQSMVRKLKND